MFSEKELPRKPLANWNAVAKEILHHPYRSGLLDVVGGTGYLALGVATATPFRMALGGVWIAAGASIMHNYINAYRPLAKPAP